MTATLILIRHAAHAHLGRTLSGRMAGLGLTDAGREQAARLAAMLAGQVSAVHSSPLTRARETAQAIADVAGANTLVTVEDSLTEIDFGAWTGQRFVDLESDPEWTTWNSRRSSARVPGGESMAEAQERIAAHLRAAARAYAGETVAVITHCDMIRAAVAHVLGLSLDHILRFDIDPASMTRVTMGAWGARVLCLNEVAR